MYGVFHIFLGVAQMIAMLSISAILQVQFGNHLRSDLNGNSSTEDIQQASLSRHYPLPNADVQKILIQCRRSMECLDKYPQDLRNIIRAAFLEALSDSFGMSFDSYNTFTLVND
jgi:hypothetical protein